MKNVFKLIGLIAFVSIIGFTFAACPDPAGGGGGGGDGYEEPVILTMRLEETEGWNEVGHDDWGRWNYNHQDEKNLFDISSLHANDKVYIFSYSFTSDTDIDHLGVQFYKQGESNNWEWKEVIEWTSIKTDIKKGTRHNGKIVLFPNEHAADSCPEETYMQITAHNRHVHTPATLSFYKFEFEEVDKEFGLDNWTVSSKDFTIDTKKTFAEKGEFLDKSDVLHIRPSYNLGAYGHQVMNFDLSSYAGKTIEIVMSMDVYLKKPARIAWQIDSSDPFYPVVCGNVEPDTRIPFHGAPPLSANTWHSISGSYVITVPSGGGRKLYLSDQQFNGAEAYFANAEFTINQNSGSYNPTPVTFMLSTNGSRTQTTTLLTLTFNQAIPGLSAENIILSGAVSGVAKGTLSGTGPTYILPISGFTSGGNLMVWVTKLGFEISSAKTVKITYYNSGSGGGGSGGGIFKNFDDFKKWFQKQNTNSIGNPFNVNLKLGGDLSGLLEFLKGMGGKFVNFDLSGWNFTNIGANAFDGCLNLTGLTLPFGLNSIGQYAFRGCSNLTSVTFLGTIPSGSFASNAFDGLGDLRDKYLAGGPGTYTRQSGSNTWTKDTGTGGDDSGGGGGTIFTSIDAFAVWLAAQPANTAVTTYNAKLNISDHGGSAYGFGSLGYVLRTNSTKYVSLDLSGSTFTSISANAFESCNKLTGIIIPSGVTSIGGLAFNGCSSLTGSINIPRNVTSIEEQSFSGNYFAAIYVDANNSAYSSEDGVLYNKNKTTLVAYANGKTGSYFIIPNSVTSIGGYSFSCANLISVTIPSSVTSIGGLAFYYNCTNLTNVTFQGTIASGNISPSGAFWGDLRAKYLVGGAGTYTTTAPVGSSSVWTKEGGGRGSNGNPTVWTAVNSVNLGGSFVSVAWGSNKFVVIGTNDLYSSDGINWTAINSDVLKTINNAIIWGGNKFVGAGYGGKIAYSFDGINWTAVLSSPFYIQGYNYTIAYGNNKFVIAGYPSEIAYSSDGIYWTKVAYTTFTNNSYIYGITYGNGKFVAGAENGQMAYSTDGINWTKVANSTFGTNGILGIAYGNNKFVAVGGSGKMAYSPDGINWTAVANNTFTNSIWSITYDGNKFVAGGNNGKMAYSSDGINWTAVTNSTFGNTDEDRIYGIAWGSNGSTVNKFVAVGQRIEGGSNRGKIAYWDDN